MNSIKSTYKGRTLLIHGWTDDSHTRVYGVDWGNKPFKLLRSCFPRVETRAITKIDRSNRALSPKKHKNPEAAEFAKSFTYGIPELQSEVKGCVYKLWYGQKFMIIKAKYLRNSLEIRQRNYAYFYYNNHQSNDRLKNDQDFKFFDYCRKHHGKFSYRVELVLESESPLELLEAEQELLLAEMRNKKCMNNSIVSYLPKWVPVEDVEKFKELYKDTVKFN